MVEPAPTRTNVVCLAEVRRRRACEALAAAGVVVPQSIAPRFSTERLEAMVDAATRYQRQFDAYWAPAPGSNG